MRYQLRDYRIEHDHLDEFLHAWTTGVLPLRRQFGFEVSAWVDRESARFIWVLGHAQDEDFEKEDRRYYESSARARLNPDPAQWIVEAQHSWIVPITPSCGY